MVSDLLISPSCALTWRVGTTSGGGTVPTVTDNAFNAGVIGSKVLGISFAPTTELSVTNGQLTFGGIDDSLFTGPLTTVYVFGFLRSADVD